MLKWLKNSFLVLLFLAVAYLLTVQVLRAIAMGDEEREALALMEAKPAPPSGSSGFKYLAFTRHEVPAAELDQALARDLAAYREWHAGWGKRLVEQGATDAGESTAQFESPVAASYPERPLVQAPDAACGLGDAGCLGKLRGHEDAIRAWLQADADRLALAEQALRSDHLSNPYPSAIDSPLAGFQVLRLPVNDIALQALDGDVAGATVRACRLLMAERRFLRQDGPLIDKMVHGALVSGASGLLLELRRMYPAVALPADCEPALAPVDASDFLACGAFRHEYATVANLSTAMDGAMRGTWNPSHWLSRLALTDDELTRAWSARNFAPMCEPEGIARIMAGQVPEPDQTPYDQSSVDYWAAPISHILSAIAAPAYGQYQDRLLDSAASLRLHLAAIAAIDGDLAPEQVPTAAASPGYQITVEDGHWVLPLRRPRDPGQPSLRLPLPR